MIQIKWLSKANPTIYALSVIRFLHAATSIPLQQIGYRGFFIIFFDKYNMIGILVVTLINQF